MLEQLNRLVLVIFVYICLYGVIVFFQPEISFNNRNNSLRQFGVGYKHTTIMPLWLISILFAIISYFIVLYILHLRYNTIFINV
jgi:quinol-cytochrome oxidoreductase complex cytochrome b subunit